MKKLIVQLAFIVLAVSVVFISGVSAAIINVASPYGDTQIQAAINAATAGDIVSIPASNVTWTGSVNLNKNVILQGAGKTNTLVTWNSSGNAINATGTWRITGIGFTKGSNTTVIISIPVDTSSANWRVDHCDFTSSSGYGESISIFGGYHGSPTGYGLADHNTHTNMRAVVVFGNDCAPTGDREWSRALSLGTANAVYVEDSTITNTISQNGYEETDQNCGGRIVFRYNTVTDFNFGIHSVQGATRGARSWEFYNNTFIASSLPAWVVGNIRGGTGVVFNNTITGNFGYNIFLLDNVRSCQSRDISLLCDGTSPWDGTGTAGYPCRDQIGRSTDASQWTSGSPYPAQALSPAYFWNNKKGTGEIPAAVSATCTNQYTYHILENRDFYNADSTNCPANPTGSCTAGVGVGTFANRPASCTTNASEAGGGVGYWATDTNTLYRCSATNTWTVHYKPYTYPHPLSGPQPPQNVKIKN